MPTYQHPVPFLLGLEGIALLRAFAGDGYDRAFVDARIAEVRAILAHAEAFGDGLEIGEIDTVDGYRSWSATYDEPGNPLIEVEEPIVRELIDGIPAGRALDAACGTGRHTAYLATRGHQVSGVDSSPDMLAKAQIRLPGADIRHADLTALPFADGTFDLVVCGLALCHLPALGPAMSEFARVLAPGGHLITSDIHVLSLYLGGVAGAIGPDGQLASMPASRFFASDYLTAARDVGLGARGCREPRWPASDSAGGPQAQDWCADAAGATYTGVPAAMIWHFQHS